MNESFFDTDEHEFSFNSQVHCGQSLIQLGFARMTLEDRLDEFKSRQPARSESRRFLPAVVARKH